MKTNVQTINSIICLTFIFSLAVSASNSYVVPFGGNAFAVQGGSINDNGFTFDSLPATATLYLYVSNSGDVSISLTIQNTANDISINVQIAAQSISADAKSSDNSSDLFIGNFTCNTGYNQVKVTVQGSNSNTTGIIANLLALGNTPDFSISNYISNFPDFSVGRTGFGVKLIFNTDSLGLYKVDSVYSQITVPAEGDVNSTNINAIGFDLGFFRLSVSAIHQKTVSFGVTSQFPAIDPKDIPAFYALKDNKIGFNVVKSQVGATSVFSLDYEWVSNKTYKFLITSKKDLGAFKVTYTAWFFDPITSNWIFIADCSQLQLTSYLSGLFVSVEPKSAETGNQVRSVVVNKFFAFEGLKQIELLQGSFMVNLFVDGILFFTDRRDTFGGVDSFGSAFLLKTAGFFNETTSTNTQITRSATQPPNLNIKGLKVPKNPFTVYLRANSYTHIDAASIDFNGYQFTSLPASATAYIYAATEGNALLSLTLLPHSNTFQIRVSSIGQIKTVSVAASSIQQTVFIGDYYLQPNYNQFYIDVLSNNGLHQNTSGTIVTMNFDGLSSEFQLSNYVAIPQSYDYARAGASPILYYSVNELDDVMYAYSEITVPKGMDAGRTHFAALVFPLGGITLDVYPQKNNKTVSLFLNIADGNLTSVTINRQNDKSFLRNVGIWHLNFNYTWSTDTTYKCLLKAVPDLQTNTTNVTAWIHKPEDVNWTLIGEVSFHKTYTFLDKISTEIHVISGNIGDLQKQAYISNVWAFDTKLNPEELLQAEFYEDVTVIPPDVIAFRKDFYAEADGQDMTRFVLSTGGFSDKYTEVGSTIQREASKSPVNINFATLP